MPKQCNRKADVGFTNLYGSPYLKFTLRCQLPEGHKGKHQGVEKVGVAPTHEGGDPIKRGSIEVEPVTIRWEGE